MLFFSHSPFLELQFEQKNAHNFVKITIMLGAGVLKYCCDFLKKTVCIRWFEF